MVHEVRAGTIPKVFHFVFGLRKQTEQFHLTFYLCLKSCLEINKPDRIYFYYHHLPYGRYWDLIKPHLTLVKVPLRKGLEKAYTSSTNLPFSYAHQADFIRVEKVLEHGGVYADIDTLFVNPLPDSLYRHSFVIGQEDDVFCDKRQRFRPSLCNAFFMGAPQAPFLREWLRLMPAYFDGTWSNHSCYLPYVLSERHPDWVHVQSARAFYRYMWTQDDLERLFRGCEDPGPGVYSIHLWNHLWWDRRRVDFSDFHAGLITEKRIRTEDTTYNLLARPFLPEAGETPRLALRHGMRDLAGFFLRKATTASRLVQRKLRA